MGFTKFLEKEPKITQKFGEKLFIGGKDIYKQSGLNGHNGIDFGIKQGTKLFSAIDGIAEVVNQGKNGYGLFIRIIKNRGEDGFTEVLYGHLKQSVIKTGDVVKAGDLIGFSGGNKNDKNSGTSTGEHLHFGFRLRDKNNKIINYNNGFLGRIDPMQYYKEIEW